MTGTSTSRVAANNPAIHPRAGRPTAAELSARLSWIENALIAETPRPKIIAAVRKDWGVSLRTAQKYLRKARNRREKHVFHTERRAQLRHNIAQRDRLVRLLCRAADDFDNLPPQTARLLARLVNLASNLLDGKNDRFRQLLDLNREGQSDTQSATDVFHDRLQQNPQNFSLCAHQNLLTDAPQTDPNANDVKMLSPAKADPQCAPLWGVAPHNQSNPTAKKEPAKAAATGTRFFPHSRLTTPPGLL